MGLDTCIYRMQKLDCSKVWTDEEIYKVFSIDNHDLKLIKPVAGDPDFTIEGADGYLFRCVNNMYSAEKMMAALGIRKEDGWVEGAMSSAPQHTPKDMRPNEDDVEWWFTFENHHASDNYDDWEFREIPALRNDLSMTTPIEYWCILTIGDDLADMRKGANAKFYDDGLWDDNWYPVCSKRILKEHMEKYFDDKETEYFGNPRQIFKSTIYEKFEDGKGLCVLYV